VSQQKGYVYTHSSDLQQLGEYCYKITAFNIAVWNVIRHFASSLARVRPLQAIASRIVEEAALGLSAFDPDTPRDSPEVILLANLPPQDALVGFTDGSRLSSGQSGAGVLVRPFRGFGELRLSVPLGRNSNNVAELYALGRIFILLLGRLEACSAPTDTRVLVFSDSSFAINVVVKGSSSGGSKALAHWARKAYRRLLRRCTLEVHWIRGHSAVDGNEIADELAGLAAKDSEDASADHLLDLDSLWHASPSPADRWPVSFSAGLGQGAWEDPFSS
jgi:ribonuclease HI